MAVSGPVSPANLNSPTAVVFEYLDINGIWQISTAASGIPVNVPGGRNPTSSTNNYLVAVPEVNVTVLAPGLAQTITSSPALLLGIAGANGVVNGSVVTLLDGGSTIETFPASSIPIAGIPFYGSKLNTSLIISIVVASGTSLKVYWRAQ